MDDMQPINYERDISPPRALDPLLHQGDLRDQPRGDGPPDGIATICGSVVREPHHIHLLQVLRHAFVPAPFLAWRRDRLRAISRHPHL